ncbi:hypothetical protein DPSP01_014134 [Paraphaeosphaeria sporulosa]
MRLLKLSGDDEFSFTKNILDENRIPPYAILSHTWQEGEEVTFDEFSNESSKSKAGYTKLRFCAQQAKRDGLEYFWVDTCCIDKSSSAELQEAINSMFRWYQNAKRCYVYLSDVLHSPSDSDDECSRRWKPAFKKSRWFTRGWTLQELIAPASVEFFSKEGTYLGNKQSLEQTVQEITGIAVKALRRGPLSQFSKDERLSWAAKRRTTREEDRAYCLLGIFDIYMPLIYGEGRKNALARLEEQVDKKLSLRKCRRQILFDSLRFDQIDVRQTTIKNAHDKTCKWLLTKPEYIDWLDTTKLGEHHGFLWIKGKPGTGKSTLMKFALDNAPQTMTRTVISFFFNARGEDLEKSTIGTYRSLLLQLLEYHPALQCVFDTLHHSTSRISENYQWSIESLKLLLWRAIQKLGKSSVVCFIDALDECEEWQVRDMIQFFEQLGKLAVESRIHFQVCFASRHYPHITIQKGLSLVLEGQEGHDQDITNYIHSELKIGHSKVAKQIRRELQEKASGIFMWVILVVGILNKEYDSGRIHTLQRRLSDIPGDLHKLFHDILTRDSQYRDELVLCIQWTLFAKQPLSPEQLYFAILSEVEPEAVLKLDFNEITIDVIKRFILNSSKGLAEITKSRTPKVQFIHESIKDFLLKENGLGNIWPDLRSNFKGRSHERLKHCCLKHVNIDIFTHLEVPESLLKASSQKTADIRQSASIAFPFLEYAVQNVLYHADMAEGCDIGQENLIRSFPLGHWIKLDNLFKEYEVRRHAEDTSLLYVLAEGNMSNLIRIHPSILSCLKVEKERYGTPLFAALANGSKEAIQTFVEAHKATQSPESRFHDLCSRYDYQEGSQGNFGRDFTFSNQRTILSYLAELGDVVLFALGLETGNIMPDSKDQDGRTPLRLAAEKGHEAVAELLLDTNKVDINSKDRYGRTPLSVVAENGNEAVVELLLGKDGVDVNAKDFYGRTALSHAAGYRRTALSKGREKRHEAVVRLLLGRDEVDVNSKDRAYRRTPLWYAAANWHETVVELLLDTEKVDVNSKDRYGRTPLSWAAERGDEEIVQLLLRKDGVDVNSKDSTHGRTPLSWAAGNGRMAVVRQLLRKDGVDVNARDGTHGRTPLSWAAENGHRAVVELLQLREASP